MSGVALLFPYHFQFQHFITDGIAIGSNSPTCQSQRYAFSSKPCYPTLATTHAFSLSGSGAGAQYSAGELTDTTSKKQQKKRIAGIDQDELLDPKLLADPDSCFCEFKGVEIHHKLYDPQSRSEDNSLLTQSQDAPSLNIGLPMILLHGFGASVFSWNKVMKPLAHLTGSKVLAFDRPAFGLTSRLDSPVSDAKPLNPYSMAFSVLATLYFIDFLAAKKAILVGHSAGSLVAVDAYFEAPERIAALILVAPAILAPRDIPKVIKRNPSEGNNQTKGDGSDSNNLVKPLFRLLEILFKFTKFITEATKRMINEMAGVLNSLYKKALASVLRSAFAVMLVRMIIDKFGIAAVRTAWYDTKQVTEHILDGYTKPLRAKGWDRALVEFTAAMLTNGESEMKPPLAKRLQEISCPVLIVTGDTDRLVPAWNSERLSQAIPHSKLEIIKNCGHLPHEEKAQEFVKVVEKFLQRALGGLEEPSLQIVT